MPHRDWSCKHADGTELKGSIHIHIDCSIGVYGRQDYPMESGGDGKQQSQTNASVP